MWLLFCWINPSILYDTKSDIHHGNFLWLSSWNDFWHSSWHSIWHILLDNLCNICWGVLQHLLGHYVWLFYRGKIVTPSLAQVCLAKPRGEERRKVERSGKKRREVERSGEEWRGVHLRFQEVSWGQPPKKTYINKKMLKVLFPTQGPPCYPIKPPSWPNMAPTWPQHGRNMGPTWPQHGPNLNPKWIQMAAPGPNLGPMFLLAGVPGRETRPEITLNKKKCWRIFFPRRKPHKALHTTQHGPNMAQHGPNMAATWPQHGPNINPKWIQRAEPGPNLGPTFLLPSVSGRQTRAAITLNKKKMLKDIFPTQKAP